MANFPRWIDDENVDSAAMLAVFHQYKGNTSGEGRDSLNQLWTIEHQSSPVVYIGSQAVMPTKVSPPDLLERPCMQANCLRCENKSGGYQFRWYDERWYASYLCTARDGTWSLERSAENHTTAAGARDGSWRLQQQSEQRQAAPTEASSEQDGHGEYFSRYPPSNPPMQPKTRGSSDRPAAAVAVMPVGTMTMTAHSGSSCVGVTGPFDLDALRRFAEPTTPH